MCDYLRNKEEKHFKKEYDLFASYSEGSAEPLFDFSIKFHALKLLIVPFYKQIVTENMRNLMWWDVYFAVAIIWVPVLMAFNPNDKDEPTLTKSLAFFICGLFLSPFLMAFAAIDLCFNLSVLGLSLITRIVATIVHMVIYSFSGDNNKNSLGRSEEDDWFLSSYGTKN